MVGGRNLCSCFLHRQPIVSVLWLPSPICDATSLTYKISMCVVLILNSLLYFLGLSVPKNIIISTALVFLSSLFFGHAMQHGSALRISSSDQGLNLHPLKWKHWVLTSRPPQKSSTALLFKVLTSPCTLFFKITLTILSPLFPHINFTALLGKNYWNS